MDIDPLVPVAAAVLTALVLTWVLRAEFADGPVFSRFWRCVEIVVGLILMLALFYVGTLQVVVRYAPAGALYASWTEELARLLMVWMTFWGAAMVQRLNDHMSVPLLYDLLPLLGRRILDVFGDLVILGVLLVLCYEGQRIAYRQLGQSTITLDVSIAAFAYALPVCGLLMLCCLVIDRVSRLRAFFARGPAAHEGGA